MTRVVKKTGLGNLNSSVIRQHAFFKYQRLLHDEVNKREY